MACPDPIQPVSLPRVRPVDAVDLSPQVDQRDRRRQRRSNPDQETPERDHPEVTVDDDGRPHIDLLA